MWTKKTHWTTNVSRILFGGHSLGLPKDDDYYPMNTTFVETLWGRRCLADIPGGFIDMSSYNLGGDLPKSERE
jgi:hypothetical protein